MSANDTSADRFARFEESFLNSSRIVTRNITQLSGTRGRVDAINSISVDIEFELDDADSYVVAMESEFRSMPSAEKKSIQQKVRVCLIVRTLRMNIFLILIPSFVLIQFIFLIPSFVLIQFNIISQMNGYKEEVNQLKSHFKRSKGDADALALKTGSSSRQKLLTSQQKLDNSTATLEKSRMVIAQTDEIGNQTINNMESQKGAASRRGSKSR